MSKDHSARIVVFGIALAVIGMIFAAGCARADSFNERFSATTPQEAPLSAEQWGIKLLLIIDGKIVRAVAYNEVVYSSGEECKSAVLADTKLQESMQEAASAAAQSFGATAVVGIACAMHLD